VLSLSPISLPFLYTTLFRSVVPLVKLRVLNILRSTIGVQPLALKYFSHCTQATTSSKPNGNNNQVNTWLRASIKGNKMVNTANPSSSEPIGSNEVKSVFKR